MTGGFNFQAAWTTGYWLEKLCFMNLLAINNLEQNLGEKFYFEDLSFGLSKGDKVTLIAKKVMVQTKHLC